MTDIDLIHTIHFVIGATANRFVGYGNGRRQAGIGDLRSSIVSRDPDERRFYALTVHTGWLLLSIASVCAIFALAVPVRLLFGGPAGDIVARILLVACTFCAAGSANVLWRMYWYVPQARRRARKDGVDSKRFAHSMRRTLPRNSSLIFQLAVAAVTIILTR
jgi:hypothetical protein